MIIRALNRLLDVVESFRPPEDDFAAVSAASDLETETRLRHISGGFFVGNEDWSELIYSSKGYGTHAYSSLRQGMEFVGECRERLVLVRMPVDPESAYSCRVKVTRIEGDGTFSMGAWPLDNFINTMGFGNQSAFVADGEEVEGSVYFEGLVSGYRTPPDTDATRLHPNTAYVDLWIEANVGGVASSKVVIEHLEFYRSPTSFYVAGGKAWSATNDGEGSGADADTVDGKHYSDLTPIEHVGSGGDQHAIASTEAHGFISSEDKTKLDTVEEGATADMSSEEILLASIIEELPPITPESEYPGGISTFSTKAIGWPEAEGVVENIRAGILATAQFFHGTLQDSTTWLRRWDADSVDWGAWRRIGEPDPHAETHFQGGSDELTAPNIGAAPITHVTRHHSDGADPLLPADIGALEAINPTASGLLSLTQTLGGLSLPYLNLIATDSTDWQLAITNLGDLGIWNPVTSEYVVIFRADRTVDAQGNLRVRGNATIDGTISVGGGGGFLTVGYDQTASVGASGSTDFTHGLGVRPRIVLAYNVSNDYKMLPDGGENELRVQIVSTTIIRITNLDTSSASVRVVACV